MLRGKRLKKMYKTFRQTYYEHVGATFKFKSGEKGRLKRTFIMVAEAMGIRDKERFEEVLDMFKKYVVKKINQWLKWKHRSRGNLMGFLEKSDEIEIFVRGEQVTTLEQDNQAEGLDIAGTEDDSSWDF